MNSCNGGCTGGGGGGSYEVGARGVGGDFLSYGFCYYWMLRSVFLLGKEHNRKIGGGGGGLQGGGLLDMRYVVNWEWSDRDIDQGMHVAMLYLLQ